MGLDTAFVRDVTRGFLRDVMDTANAMPEVVEVIVVSDDAIENEVGGDARFVADQRAAAPDGALEVCREVIRVDHPASGMVVVAPDLPALDSETLRGVMESSRTTLVADIRDAASDRPAVLAMSAGHTDAQTLRMTAVERKAEERPTSRTRVRTWRQFSSVLDAGVGRHTMAAWQTYGLRVCATFGLGSPRESLVPRIQPETHR
jgi:hypothetical protein